MTGGYSWLSTKHHHQQHIMEQSASQLLALADELLIEIISQIEDRQSLCCLARVSPRLQGLAEPYIYDSILTRTGDQARNLVQLFESRNARLRAVHDLQIRYLYSSEDGIEDLNAVLKGLTQLRHLRIETPCCNDSPWMDLPGKPALLWANGGRIDIPGLFEMALTLPTSVKPGILGQLQSLVLHSHGNGEGSVRYELGDSAIIFLLANLRSITLSCFDIGMNENLEEVLSKNPKFRHASKSTALETLIFEECNISFQGFEVLLKLPKALKNLTLGERMHHTSSVVPLGFRSKLLEALEPQRSSIKYLKHVGGGKYWSQAYLLPFFREDISYLQALETIELGPALEGKYITQGLPPTLRKIRFLDAFQGDLNGKSSLFENPMWSSSFHNSGLLHQIDLVLYRGQDYELWLSEGRREEVNTIATKLLKQNTELAIYTPKPCERSLIPPYMYGEELPEEELSYISSNPNMFGNKFYELVNDPGNVDDETHGMSVLNESNAEDGEDDSDEGF